MTLKQLLEIDINTLEPNHAEVIEIAEQKWLARGKPTGRWELFDLFGNVIDECKACGIEYPPIVLKRKEQLKRGTFQPRSHGAQAGQPSTMSAGSRCQRCGGRGYLSTPHGAEGCRCLLEKYVSRESG